MADGSADRKTPLQDRRMWRLLLARLHPDAGGDRELFLFASALRASTGGDRPFGSAGDSVGAETFLRNWRGTMDSWASDNRNSLRGYRTRRDGPRCP